MYPGYQISAGHTHFLEALDELWRKHCKHMSSIRNIFLYLDRCVL